MRITNCPCGETHHVDDRTWLSYCRITAGLPPTMEIEVPAGRWLVPRLYLIKHEITAQKLPTLAAQYGWPRI